MITEDIELVGELSIFKEYWEADRIKDRILAFKDWNLITNASKRYLLSGLYTQGVVSDPIVNLKAGTGGTIDPDGLYPKPENPDQLDLITPIITIPTAFVVDSANILVTFLADIDQSQSNGSLITEAGLFKFSGQIFNVKNHPGIAKQADFSIHYEWNIRYL